MRRLDGVLAESGRAARELEPSAIVITLPGCGSFLLSMDEASCTECDCAVHQVIIRPAGRKPGERLDLALRLAFPFGSEAPEENFRAYGMIFPRCFWIYCDHQPPAAFCYSR